LRDVFEETYGLLGDLRIATIYLKSSEDPLCYRQVQPIAGRLYRTQLRDKIVEPSNKTGRSIRSVYHLGGAECTDIAMELMYRAG